MHILVVEDDPRIAAFVTRGLEESGYATTVTCGDADGVEISASISPDWARGSTYRELGADQRAELIERLTSHGPKVCVTVGNGRIDLGIPT